MFQAKRDSSRIHRIRIRIPKSNIALVTSVEQASVTNPCSAEKRDDNRLSNVYKTRSDSFMTSSGSVDLNDNGLSCALSEAEGNWPLTAESIILGLSAISVADRSSIVCCDHRYPLETRIGRVSYLRIYLCYFCFR